MHLPVEPARLKKGGRPQLWETLERLRLTLGVSQTEWADRLLLTEKDYLRGIIENIDPSAMSVMSLAEQLELDFDSIMNGELDFKGTAARFHGDEAYVPEKYAKAAFSKRRTSINVLDYLETFHGWRARIRTLRKFQLSEAVFADPDATMSLRFLADLCESFRQQGYVRSDFFAMGAHSVVTNFNSELGRTLRKSGTPMQLHEQLFKQLAGQYYDRNFSYHIDRLRHDHCAVEVRPSEELLDAQGDWEAGSAEICMTKSGTFASLIGYLGLPFSTVEERSCIHRGDAVCRYHIDFESPLRFAHQHGLA